jgi:hypothetical protein
MVVPYVSADGVKLFPALYFEENGLELVKPTDFEKLVKPSDFAPFCNLKKSGGGKTFVSQYM